MTDPAVVPSPWRRILPELAMIATVLVWASTFIITKDALEEVRPLAFISVRFTLMTVMAFIVLWVGKRRGGAGPFTVARADWPRLLGAGACGYILYQLGFVFGVERTSPFAASLLIGLTPLITLLILALLGERAPVLGWAGVLVAIIGILLFLQGKDSDGMTLSGNLLSLGAAIAFGTYMVVNRPIVRKYPSATYTAWQLLGATIPLVLVGLPQTLAQDWGSLSTRTWLSILYMVIFPVYLAYIVWNYAIRERGPTVASSFHMLVPVASGVLSAVVVGEAFGVSKLGGAVLVLGGMGLIRYATLRKPAPGVAA